MGTGGRDVLDRGTGGRDKDWMWVRGTARYVLERGTGDGYVLDVGMGDRCWTWGRGDRDV